jgi:lipopolysaccharide export system protein LptA
LHNFTRAGVDFGGRHADHSHPSLELKMMKLVGICLLCAASTLTTAYAETFVIEADASGHEATIRIPVGAVTKLSANSAESLEGYGDSQDETMRLSGDVLISIAGSQQPIEIKADKVLLELTADSIPHHEKGGRAEAATHKLLRSTTTFSGAENSQVFVGNVVFDLQTSSGPMEIKADKVEHQLRTEAGA